MGFLKTLFGGREESPEEKAEKRREREFDVLKYDGVRARKIGEVKYAIRCFREALALRNDTETASYLAEALLSDKQAEEARSILAKLAEELPDHIGVRLAMARADEMMQDYTRMDEDCRAALQIDNGPAGALYRSAQALSLIHIYLTSPILRARTPSYFSTSNSRSRRFSAFSSGDSSRPPNNVFRNPILFLFFYAHKYSERRAQRQVKTQFSNLALPSRILFSWS